MHVAVPQKQDEQQQSLLLALPEPLLLAVLQFLAADKDHRSLFSAALAHSRLHQAAVAALSSISVGAIQQQALDSVLLYLGKHGQHVRSISLRGAKGGSLTRLRHLPPTPQLHSLDLLNMHLQLLPGNGFQGVLGYDGMPALKHLQLESCTLQEDPKGLAAALAQLPLGLQHLMMICVKHDNDARSPVGFPTDVLQQRLQQLTQLDLVDVELQGAGQSSLALQPLQALSRLVDLRLFACRDGAASKTAVLTASMLSGATGLTRLELWHLGFEPATLAGRTQLQHLGWVEFTRQYDATCTAQLLSRLAPLQQLTHLMLMGSLDEAAPAAAYSALTASSKLRHLDITHCTLPAAVWQHMFSAGRQLPHLTSLRAGFARQQPHGPFGVIAVPEGSRLISCCPGLQSLDVRELAYTAGAFSSLQGLTGLRTLLVETDSRTCEPLREVFQLTGLRDLHCWIPTFEDELLLLQMTQLRQLTRLDYDSPHDGGLLVFVWTAEAPGDEPVWRRVLRAHLNHSDPAVAQQAAAALAAE